MRKPQILTYLALAALSALSLILSGCAHGEESDTSPLPPTSPQTKLENAKKSIEASTTMTPEQKKAALEYAQRGAEGAERMKQSAPHPPTK